MVGDTFVMAMVDLIDCFFSCLCSNSLIDEGAPSDNAIPAFIFAVVENVEETYSNQVGMVHLQRQRPLQLPLDSEPIHFSTNNSTQSEKNPTIPGEENIDRPPTYEECQLTAANSFWRQKYQ